MPRKSIVASSVNELFRIQEPKNNIQENRKKIINEIFDMWDLDGDNRVKTVEVRKMLNAMGREVSNEEMMDFLKIADKNNSGLIDKIQFMEAMEKIFSLPNDGVEEVKNAFYFFDPNETGKISTTEFKKILLKQDFSEDDVENIIKVADPDDTGFIDVESFVDTWKFQ